MNNLHDFYQEQAIAFIRRHYGAHLTRDDLTQRAIDHLQVGFNLSDATAERYAVRALCELESQRTAMFIDVDNSTAHMLVIYDPQRKASRTLSIADLARLFGTGDLAPIRTPSHRAAMAGKNIPLSDQPVFAAQ